MSEPQLTTSTGVGTPPVMGKSSWPAPPFVATTAGSGVAPFDSIKKYLSHKPLRVRVMDDPEMSEKVRHLSEAWVAERPRGVDLEQMTDTPAYREIIAIGYRAIRPLLLILLKSPDHWFIALQAITGENPVPSNAEGRVVEMAGAWIKWGRERGYLRDLD